MDLEYGNIWCAACQDYVYDTELKMISEQHLAESHRNLGLGILYEPWYPSAKVFLNNGFLLFEILLYYTKILVMNFLYL